MHGDDPRVCAHDPVQRTTSSLVSVLGRLLLCIAAVAVWLLVDEDEASVPADVMPNSLGFLP